MSDFKVGDVVAIEQGEYVLLHQIATTPNLWLATLDGHTGKAKQVFLVEL